jgi:hypothetical protein
MSAIATIPTAYPFGETLHRAGHEHLVLVGFSRFLTTAIGAASLAALPVDGRGDADARTLVADTTSGPVQAPPVPAGQRASGAVFIGYRGSDGETTGAVATLSPLWRTFLRVGAEVTPRSPDGDARFLWGLGIEDPRERTFFLHVHDWGPVRPERAFTLRDAEGTFGYKLPRVRGGPFLLATSLFATYPFDGGPFVGARTALTIGRTWFLSTAFGWTIPGVLPASGGSEEWRLSFALGRWDARPGGLFVTYRDDLSDRQYRDWSEIDRHGRGVLAVGMNWML